MATTSTSSPPISPSTRQHDTTTATATTTTAAAAASAATKTPTIFVAHGSRTVKARVEPGVPLSEILRQLVASTQLGLGDEAPAQYALRAESSGLLLTEENMPSFLQEGQPRFILTTSPTLEAVELVEKLLSTDLAVQKLATFSLRTLIREDGFLIEFEQRGGLQALQQVIRKASGNTLAYALLSLHNFLQDDRGWQGLDKDFAGRIVQIIAKEPLINVIRPATAILRRLSQTPLAASSEPSSSTDIKSLPVSGFATIYAEIAEQPDFLRVVLSRLSSGDVVVATLSLDLINSLFRGATEMGDLRFGEDLETLHAWKLVRKLLETQVGGGGDLTSLLAFQNNVIAFLHLELLTPLTESLYGLFDDVWFTSGIEDGDESTTTRWRRLGYETESPQYEYQQTGTLGLKAFAAFARSHTSEFSAALKDQYLRPEDKRCPIARVSSTVVLILADHFDIVHGVTQNPTIPQPCLLRFYECHALATLFFTRMWQESGATLGDFDRVSTLTRSQVEAVLVADGERSWYEIKQDFSYAEYRTVRDRQMKEMEIEDDILSKAPVRNLRGRLYRESYEFVRSQRISCLHEGAWFRSPPSNVPGSLGKKASQASTTQPWRFYRLAANRKILHFVETNQRVLIRGGLEDLPNRIDLSSVTEIVGSASTAAQRKCRSHSMSSSTKSPPFSSVTSRNTASTTPNPLAFALVSTEGIIAELIAPNQETYSEWVDGLALLRPDGTISTKETADFVQILTDINAKIKLLDLSGERVEIPAHLAVSAVPQSTDFFYADSI